MIQLPTLQARRPKVLDNSQIGTYDSCPRKGWLRYGLGRTVGSYPLFWGELVHQFQELYVEGVNQGLEGTELFNFASTTPSARWENPPAEHYKAWMTTGRLLETFKECFSFNESERRGRMIQVVESELPFEIDIGAELPFGGKIDQIINFSGSLAFRDFKTTSMMGKTYSSKFDPDHQMSGYAYASSELSGKRVRKGQIITIYNTLRQGPEMHPFLISRTDFQLDQWAESIRYSIARIVRMYDDDIFPMNTNHCDSWGGCEFRGFCNSHGPHAMEAWLLDNTEEDFWDFTKGA